MEWRDLPQGKQDIWPITNGFTSTTTDFAHTERVDGAGIGQPAHHHSEFMSTGAALMFVIVVGNLKFCA
jgi:hypothetical protein